MILFGQLLMNVALSTVYVLLHSFILFVTMITLSVTITSAADVGMSMIQTSRSPLPDPIAMLNSTSSDPSSPQIDDSNTGGINSMLQAIQLVLSSSSLLVVVLSTNFSELKSSVFKKCDSPALLQILYADIVERFFLVVFLVLIIIQEAAYMGLPVSLSELYNAVFGSDPLTYVMQLFSDSTLQMNWTAFTAIGSTYLMWCRLTAAIFGLLIGSELIVDWIKHGFILKFNRLQVTVGSMNAKGSNIAPTTTPIKTASSTTSTTSTTDSTPTNPSIADSPTVSASPTVQASSAAVTYSTFFTLLSYDYIVAHATKSLRRRLIQNRFSSWISRLPSDDYTQAVTRRYGFAALPFSVLVLRVIVHSLSMSKVSTWTTTIGFCALWCFGWLVKMALERILYRICWSAIQHVIPSDDTKQAPLPRLHSQQIPTKDDDDQLQQHLTSPSQSAVPTARKHSLRVHKTIAESPTSFSHFSADFAVSSFLSVNQRSTRQSPPTAAAVFETSQENEQKSKTESD